MDKSVRRQERGKRAGMMWFSKMCRSLWQSWEQRVTSEHPLLGISSLGWGCPSPGESTILVTEFAELATRYKEIQPHRWLAI